MSRRQLAPESDEQTIFVEGLTGWKFIDNRKCSVADWIRSHLPSSTSASICVAYLSPSGFRTIEDELEHFLSKGVSPRLSARRRLARLTPSSYFDWLTGILRTKLRSIRLNSLSCLENPLDTSPLKARGLQHRRCIPLEVVVRPGCE